ncbi:flagellar basal-body MS-ring/collar protein FliF [Acidimangrovimonas sediminis]|uniref:flagellar basal-body MS-ring/collar protein FliF n=1 Tax=Acidimangrovimonas sediminis TaxID=2056283 RepID=UPI0018EDADCA|nr:flagellar basal-body MS-ring/collar protein FliF [Acidimangrovimonas sediminis]
MLSMWRALDARRRIIVIVATLAMFGAVLGLSRMATQPSLTLLYAGLEPGPAGEVVRALDQRGVSYQVRGDSIWVDAAQRDSLRMTLAAEGLPANGAAGYELLDGLSGFGTTSQMFDAAYWRAKEGELARTILASPDIRAARVHISSSRPEPFLPDVKPTASVTVTTSLGTLPEAQVKALKFLVASAVAGLQPRDVAVIDSSGGLLQAGDDVPGGARAGTDRAAALKQNVERLLAARVGAGHAVVEVNVETETSRESITEKRFDPQNRVAISSETQERSNSSQGNGGAGVTVASNLPTGDANAQGSSSKSQESETRERVNYEVSQTQRQLDRGPGAVKRLSVAVLVDGIRTTDAAGKETWAPRPEAELTALRDLVASAVGFDEKRGDVITLKTLQFEPLAALGTPATASMFGAMALDPMTLIQIAVLSVVALALGLFVLRPILTQARGAQAAGGDLAGLPAPDGAWGGAELPRVVSGEIDIGDGLGNGLGDGFGDGLGGLPDLPVFNPEMPGMGLGGDAGEGLAAGNEDPVVRLRRLIEERQDETVAILRSWMEETDDSRERA